MEDWQGKLFRLLKGSRYENTTKLRNREIMTHTLYGTIYNIWFVFQPLYRRLRGQGDLTRTPVAWLFLSIRNSILDTNFDDTDIRRQKTNNRD